VRLEATFAERTGQPLPHPVTVEHDDRDVARRELADRLVELGEAMAGSAERRLDLAAQSLGLLPIEAEFLHQRWPLEGRLVEEGTVVGESGLDKPRGVRALERPAQGSHGALERIAVGLEEMRCTLSRQAGEGASGDGRD
jgi:hypothetical protein